MPDSPLVPSCKALGTLCSHWFRIGSLVPEVAAAPRDEVAGFGALWRALPRAGVACLFKLPGAAGSFGLCARCTDISGLSHVIHPGEFSLIQCIHFKGTGSTSKRAESDLQPPAAKARGW